MTFSCAYASSAASTELDLVQGAILLGKGHSQSTMAPLVSDSSLTFSPLAFIEYGKRDNKLHLDTRIHQTWSPTATSLLDAVSSGHQPPLSSKVAAAQTFLQPAAYKSGYSLSSFGVMDSFSISRLLMAIAPGLAPILAIIVLFGVLFARDRRHHHADQ